MKFNSDIYTSYKLPKSNIFYNKFILPKQKDLIVTFQLNRKLPYYSWFQYKQGFSKDLVLYILSQINMPKDAVVYDPFLGSGTTALSAYQLGYNVKGSDLLPLLVFVANAKLNALRITNKQLKDGFNLFKSQKKKYRAIVGKAKKWPEIKLVSRVITKETQSKIYAYKEIIKGLHLDENVINLLLLALINTIEDCAYIKKDGGFARVVPNKVLGNVDEVFEQEVNKFITDLPSEITLGTLPKHELFVGDARKTGMESNSVDLTITSPPYLNKTDYTRIYCLELAFDFVNSFEQLRDLRHKSFSSHVEAKRQFTSIVLPSSIEKKLNKLESSTLNNPKNPDMARGYYEDLYYSLKENYRITKKGGRSCWVVWNSRLSGIEFEVDTDLAIIAESIGFEVKQIECVRLTGTSSQQVRLYGEKALRESIIYLKK